MLNLSSILDPVDVMSKIFRNLAVPNGHKNLALSDEELNVAQLDGREGSRSLNSGSSLPRDGGPSHDLGTVASWAISFEKLLEDPNGVVYFTAFLKSEVSVENIQFWQACERFRKIPAHLNEELSREAQTIYNTYLSNGATYPINIDDKARIQDQDLESPTPTMFDKAQQQIFKLMKFDSYTRFIRSPIYQSCMLANVEGRALPEMGHVAKTPEGRGTWTTGSPTPSDRRVDQKSKLKSGKSVTFDTEDGAEKKKGTTEKKAWEKRRDKRGSWGAEMSDYNLVPSSERQGLSRMSSGVEWASLAAKSDMKPASLCDPGCATSRLTEKYCCVFLPDGTASLVVTRSGVSVRDMLAVPCKKRGIPLSDVTVYLQSNDKEPLSLDLDSYTLQEQQIVLELQITFMVDMAFSGKTIHVTEKSSKSLREALLPILQKHGVQLQDTTVTMSGSKDPLDLTMNITSLANQQLHLDKISKIQNQHPGASVPGPAHQKQPIVGQTQPAERLRPNSRRRNAAVRRTYDMDGLMELLTRAQYCSADDQRGLLSKEHLEIPSFLQLPLVEGEDEGQEEMDVLKPGSTPPFVPSSETEEVRARTRSTSSDSGSLFICADSARETIV